MDDERFEKFLTERNDSIDNAAYQLLCAMTDCVSDETEWSMEYIGAIEDYAEMILRKHGLRVCHPFYEDTDTEDCAPCYRGCDCRIDNCPMRKKKDKGER